MKNTKTVKIGTVEEPLIIKTPAPTLKETGRDIGHAFKHTSRVAAHDSVKVGSDIKAMTVEFIEKSVEGGKELEARAEDAAEAARKGTVKAARRVRAATIDSAHAVRKAVVKTTKKVTS